MVSPLVGTGGNVEFLAHLRAHTASTEAPVVDLDAIVDAARELVD
jgi:hypothetical protein